jgi:IS5 family transposase
MRKKIENQQYLPCSPASTAEVVREYEEKYRSISRTLDATPEILALVDGDLKALSRPNPRGREATYTSEIILRAMLVHQIEGGSLRATQILLTHNVFLQDFVRLGNRPALSYSFLDRCLKAVQPETWEQVNEALTQAAAAQDRIDPTELRVDTTVVETNIHYPTDSSLLWDSFRVLYRLIEHAREQMPGLVENRFHFNKVKKLHLFITRYAASRDRKRQRKVQKSKIRLIEQVERISAVATEFADTLRGVPDVALLAIALEIEAYLPAIDVVVNVAKRVWIGGETVPAAERIFSLFEPHTELIKRGRRHKPVEFGHAIWLGQSREKFITQYGVMERKIPDSQLPEPILAKHESTFGVMPETLAADKGFRGNAEAMKALREKVKVVAIPERLKDFADQAFVKLQHFRAGIEGSISCLKRVFGLLRCRLRGFKSFAAHVGLGVFCHNLVVLATGSP